MHRFALLASLALAPFALAESSATAAAETQPAARLESVGVSPVRTIPALVESTKGKPAAVTLKAFTQALENKLPDTLGRTRKFKIVSRTELDAVTGEQNLAASGNLDDADPQLAKRFKLAGAANLLVVTIDEFQDRDESQNFEASGETIRRRLTRVGATAKLIDTTSGVVRESVAVTPVTQEDLREALAQLTSVEQRTNAYPTELARLVAERIAMRLMDVRFPAKIVAKGVDNTVTLNRGDGAGIAVGQEWGVFAAGEEMRDPDTGEILGREETLIGKVVVTSVEAKFAKARIIKDQGVQPGAVLRLLPAPPATATTPAGK